MIPIADQIRALAHDAAIAAALRTTRAPFREAPTARLAHHLRVWLDALAVTPSCCAADLEDQALGSQFMLGRAARVALRCGWMQIASIGPRARRYYRITEAGRAVLAEGTFTIPEGVSRT